MTHDEFAQEVRDAVRTGRLIVMHGPAGMADQIRIIDLPPDPLTVSTENPVDPWQRLTELVGVEWQIQPSPANPNGPFCLDLLTAPPPNRHYGTTPDECAAKAVETTENKATITALVHAYRDAVSLIEATADPLVMPIMIGGFNDRLLDDLRELKNYIGTRLTAYGYDTNGVPQNE